MCNICMWNLYANYLCTHYTLQLCIMAEQVPVAWSVDPVLSERFPALMDYYATTAKPTDSFIGGVAGAGYVYLGIRSPTLTVACVALILAY